MEEWTQGDAVQEDRTEESPEEYAARNPDAWMQSTVRVFLPGVSRYIPAKEFVDEMSTHDSGYAEEIRERVMSIRAGNTAPQTVGDIIYATDSGRGLNIRYGEEGTPQTLAKNRQIAWDSVNGDRELEWIAAGTAVLLAPDNHPRDLYALFTLMGWRGRVKFSQDSNGRLAFQVTEPPEAEDYGLSTALSQVIDSA